jgi:hypothetical protein
MITSTTIHRAGVFRITAAALTITATLICGTGCRARRSSATVKNEPQPAIALVDSFAENEVRLDVIANSARSLRVLVGGQVEEVALDPLGNPEMRLVFKAAKNGFTVIGPTGLLEWEFTNLSDVVFLEPPFDDGRAVMLGTCHQQNGGPAAIRIEVGGPRGEIGCEMPSFQSTPFDLTQYRLRQLPAMRDMAAAIDDVRAREGNDGYTLWQPHRKPAGRNYQGQAYWALTKWPPNASECITYMVNVGLPNNRSSIWQVFVIDPESGQISLIRDRRTGELISLGEWLSLEDKTAVYTLDEMLEGVCDHFKEQRPKGPQGVGSVAD